MSRPTCAECDRPITIRLNGGRRYAHPSRDGHDLCQRCYDAELERARARRLAEQWQLDVTLARVRGWIDS